MKEILICICILLILLLIGALLFSWSEGWSYYDSVYATVQIITGLGFGDFVPTTNFGKALTIFVVILGLITFLLLVVFLGASLSSKVNERVEKA